MLTNIDTQINDYLAGMWVAGIDVTQYKIIHNIKALSEAQYGEVVLYSTSYGSLTAYKNKMLREDSFIVVPYKTEITTRCKCCGQVVK